MRLPARHSLTRPALPNPAAILTADRLHTRDFAPPVADGDLLTVGGAEDCLADLAALPPSLAEDQRSGLRLGGNQKGTSLWVGLG